MGTTAGTVGTALVSGATHGIGRAAALRLARDGWEVIVHGRNAERGAEVVTAIRAEGGRARFVAADLTDIGEVRRLAEEAGEVDALVNNVGTSWFGPTADPKDNSKRTRRTEGHEAPRVGSHRNRRARYGRNHRAGGRDR
ncbi:SDR family NAD(P)-dependent oxidoreductase [Streptacidiphilus sp. EB129]|uniref:SDR family NAD(P)-dependent oxidoreductase n=1 Tax=Streptacidiphilus sp. EB129 TaxID=3156262 RepID=UPI0035120B33